MHNLHVVESTEERVLHLFLRVHVVLAVVRQRLNEQLALTAGGEELLTLYSETVETAAQRQHLVCLAVDVVAHSLGKVEYRRER